MDKRITSIVLFKQNSLEKIEEIVSISNDKLNKVPFHIENREILDTLPYHTTLSVWDMKEREKVIELFHGVSVENIVLEVDDIKIKTGKLGKGNYTLYLSIRENQEVYEIRKYIYSKLMSEKYNPDEYKLHISLHSDIDYEKLLKIRERLLESFQSFKVERTGNSII